MQLLTNHNLRPYNTFGIEAKAQYWASVETIDDLYELMGSQVWALPRLVLGGGSNVLLGGDFQGLVVKMDLKGHSIFAENDEHIVVSVQAGENWHDWVQLAISKGWGGLENLSLIPGSVGAAPIQNIGAYGVELKDICESVEALELDTGNRVRLYPDACAFGYRDSIFKQQKGYIITAVNFRLTKRNHRINTSYGDIAKTLAGWGIEYPTIEDVSKAVIAIRQSKLPDPAKIGNCGSFFKNPEIEAGKFAELQTSFPNIVGYPLENGRVKVPAGWLIEQCGWKGKRIGNVGTYEKQALVLVNHGQATGSEAVALAKDIQQSVLDKFGVAIEPEVNII